VNEKSFDETDLIDKEQTENETKQAGGRADVTIEKAKTICRIPNWSGYGRSDQHRPSDRPDAEDQ
jgi:hypothetical protein